MSSDIIDSLKNWPGTDRHDNTDIPQEEEFIPLIRKAHKDSQSNIETILFKKEQRTESG